MFNSIMVIIGTIIGAGFASGKEIFTFFNVYGKFGFFGLILAQVFTGFVIYKALYLIINYNITTYKQFINTIITKSKFLSNVICNIINIFLLISFIVMVAGFAAYFTQEFNILYIIGATLIAILCFITFLKNIDALVKINKYFIPFLIFIILLLGFKNSNCFTCLDFHSAPSGFNWFISSILYASYNLIILIPILIGLKDYVLNIRNAKFVSIFTSIFLFLMSVTLFFLLNYFFTDIAILELPTIYIASLLNGNLKYICGIVILGAIFTTAISSGYGFLNNLLISNKKLYTILAAAICVLSVALSNIGFSKLLNILYPILGFLRFLPNCFYSLF